MCLECNYSAVSPPAGAQSRPHLPELQRRPGVQRGRRAEERLHQWHAPGPGRVSAGHGEAAGPAGRPVRRVQPGVGRSGVKKIQGLTGRSQAARDQP